MKIGVNLSLMLIVTNSGTPRGQEPSLIIKHTEMKMSENKLIILRQNYKKIVIMPLPPSRNLKWTTSNNKLISILIHDSIQSQMGIFIAPLF